MRITIEIDSKTEMEKLSALFKTFKINKVKVISNDDFKLPITKGDKSLNPKDLFGIWSDKPRDIETIRQAAWHRDEIIKS